MDPDFAVGPEVPGTVHVTSDAAGPVAAAPAPGGAPGDIADPGDAPDDGDMAEAAPPPVEAPLVPSAPGPLDIAGGPAESAPDDAAPDAEGAPVSPPSDPIAIVGDAEIDATLEGYGQWIETGDYGQVWRPDATVVGVDFTPYESGGSWAYTDAGWAFSCDYPWGWLPFHYGRWAWFENYWAWVPGHRWGPAWVQWRHGGGVVGWRPIAPRVRDHRRERPGGYVHGGNTVIRDHRRAEQHDAHWRFAAVSDFGRPHVRAHLYGNLAEGLRVTARVAAPPLRGRTVVRAGELMRSRFTAQPGTRFVGPAQVRDHRSAVPSTTRPAQVFRAQPLDSPPPRYVPPPRYREPVRTFQPTPYRPPIQAGQPPQAYRPPVRTFQPAPYRPPIQAGQAYRPPVRTFQPAPTITSPIRPQPFQPPRTFQPAAPAIAPRPSAPPQTSTPARSFGSPVPSGVRGGRHVR